jgi:hypothetical protein
LLANRHNNKILIFKGSSVFQILSPSAITTTLWVRNLYKDLVVNSLDLSRTHSSSTSLVGLKLIF